jgi:carbon storage regulator
MLVLSRMKDESIIINDDIVVRVVSVIGNRVTLGIEAPRMVPIDRGEVHEERASERRELLVEKQTEVSLDADKERLQR